MRFTDHPDWPRVLETIPTVVPSHRMRGVVLAIAAGCVAHIAETVMPSAMATENWSDGRVAQIVVGIMTITMNRYDRAMAAIDTRFNVTRPAPGFDLAVDAGEIERSIELARLHGGDAELAAYLLTRRFASDAPLLIPVN